MDRDKQIGGRHYADMQIQPWDIIDGWPIDEQIGFHKGNALKYLLRAGLKDDAVQDLRKAQHYIDKLIEVVQREQV